MLLEQKPVSYKLIAQTLIDTLYSHSVVSLGLYPDDLPTLLIQVNGNNHVLNNDYKVTDDSKKEAKAVTSHFIGTEGLANALKPLILVSSAIFSTMKMDGITPCWRQL